MPVVGFNSQCYDLNVLKSPLIRHLVCVDAVEDGGGGGRGAVEACNNDALQRLDEFTDNRSVDSFDARASVCSNDNGGDGDDDDSDDNGDTTSCHSSDSGNSDSGEAGDGPLRFVVKRSNALTVIETRRLHFLDITNLIAPGFSYERYLRAYGCKFAKGYFFYKWMNSLSVEGHLCD